MIALIAAYGTMWYVSSVVFARQPLFTERSCVSGCLSPTVGDYHAPNCETRRHALETGEAMFAAAFWPVLFLYFSIRFLSAVNFSLTDKKWTPERLAEEERRLGLGMADVLDEPKDKPIPFSDVFHEIEWRVQAMACTGCGGGAVFPNHASNWVKNHSCKAPQSSLTCVDCNIMFISDNVDDVTQLFQAHECKGKKQKKTT